MRIISLLPSTTEIVCALGREENLVGRSHECDYPESVRQLPECTSPKYRTDGKSYEIDKRIKAIVQEGISIYRVDADLLRKLDPDVILTQDHCEVCAVPLSEVEEAVEKTLEKSVDILSLSPTNFDEVLITVEEISAKLEVPERGENLIKEMIDELNAIQAVTENLPSPEVACIEWLDPLMTAGNWVPELVDVAGGRARLSKAGAHSPAISWKNLLDIDPDLIVITPCGFNMEQTASEIPQIATRTEWEKLTAVQQDRAFIADGSHYFNRPGPRLPESARILAEMFHPGIFEGTHKNKNWINISTL